MALVPHPKPIITCRLTNLVSKILVTDSGAVCFYELNRSGGGAEPISPPPPPTPLWKDEKSPPNRIRVGQQPLTLIWGNTECCKLFGLFICKTLMLGLYMDTTGKRFFEFCFLPKLTEGVHRFVILEEFHFWRFAKRHCFCLISEESFLRPFMEKTQTESVFPCFWQWQWLLKQIHWPEKMCRGGGWGLDILCLLKKAFCQLWPRCDIQMSIW